ncbi:MAG TPA: endo-1,4-beta-xylanase [Phnomibacter sp.]|nr:endo-1,4-beta-xylanase [Phnomibacter sp.]
MKQRLMKTAGIVATLALLTYCAAPKHKAASGNASLKDAFKKEFLVGAAIDSAQIIEKDPVGVALITKQFNSITAENVMKAEVVQPTWGHYDFTMADQLVAYGKKNRMAIHGHTLIWHSQMPQFAKQIQNADSFRTFFTNHINTVAARYSGKLISWDVVNEALNEDGTMRNSIFLQKLGPDYVVEAFRLADKASPNTDLYYNDYNNEQPKKRAGCIELVKKIKAAGVKIDGVGIQGHWHVGKVPFKEIEESIEAYAALGMKVAITELDIEVLPRNFTGADVGMRVASNPALNPYVKGIPDSVLQQQASDYKELFRIFTKHQDKIVRVTLWGVHDGQSWLNGWPVVGRTNYPLLFDRAGQPKPAYNAVMSLKQ